MDNFVTTPSSSDIDLLIEKFRLELTNEVGSSDDADTRVLTIESSVPRRNSDLDRQINDLENLIQKLQDEITELSKNADKSRDYIPNITEDEPCNVHQNLSHETVVLSNESSESLRRKMKREDTRTDIFDAEPFNHVFPLMIRDIILPDTCFKLLRSPNEQFTDNEYAIPEGILTIEQDVIDIWNDLPTFAPDDNLDGLICELQAEITEKMETLKEAAIEESIDDQDVNLKDA